VRVFRFFLYSVSMRRKCGKARIEGKRSLVVTPPSPWTLTLG
jgi:hypothetical protein